MPPRCLASESKVDETPGFPVGRDLIASGIETTGMTQQVTSTTDIEAMSPPPIEAAGGAMVLSSRSRRSVDVIAVGLAKIATERSLLGIYREAVAILSRLPSVAGVAVIRRDERGLLTAVHSVGVPMEREVERTSSNLLHQRWIASHTAKTEETAAVPFGLDSHDDVLVLPLVDGDALLGGFVVRGRSGIPPAATSAERVSAAAVAAGAAQAIAGLALRQRQEATISRSEHELELGTVRKAISHDLHDGPTQELALAGMALDRLVTALGADQAISADARQARDLIDSAVTGMRTVIGKLRTPQKPAPSMTGPLRALVAEIAPSAPELAGLEVDFKDVSGVRLAPEVERAMIGIVREALHNVRKHANADSVRLEVHRVNGEVEIVVTDDGVGFSGGSPDGHFGLEQIRELAEETGGRIEIGSSPGAGTAIRAWIPAAATYEVP